MYNSKDRKKGNFDYDTKVYWCLKHHPAVIDRFSGGISITMVCKAMRKKGYGYAWPAGQKMVSGGIHTIKKAKEVSEALFNEYAVFIPYLELMGYKDAVTMADADAEV